MTRHVVVSRGDVVGYQYGVLRDFEDALIERTSAERVEAPQRRLPRLLDARLQHGTRYGKLRRFVPRAPTAAFEADVLWVPLMGAEGFTLDLFSGWDRRARTKVLYVLDTYPRHLAVLRRIVAATAWDVLVTAIGPAVPMLERETGRRWHAMPFAAREDRFQPVPASERLIAFSAHGRREPRVHDALVQWCARRGLHYVYTLGTSVQPGIDPREVYRHYAWDVVHSVFTLNWDVAVTHPSSAGGLSPITCRWYEAGCAGTVCVGQPPSDPSFATSFGDVCVRIDPADRSLFERFDQIWARRDELLARAADARGKHLREWTWRTRVDELVDLVERRAARDPSQAGSGAPPFRQNDAEASVEKSATPR